VKNYFNDYKIIINNKVYKMKINMISIILITALFLCDCDHITQIIDEPDDIISSWQSSPKFDKSGEKIVFEGLYDSLNAVHFIDKNGNYLGHVLESQKNINNFISSPSWDPNSKKISVSINGNLYLINIDGDSLTQLTFTGQDFGCSWAPNGSYIAYTKTICDPNCGISLYDLNNKTNKIIGEFGGHASWNKNSSKVFYSTNYFVKRINDIISDYKGFVFRSFDINNSKNDSLFYVTDTNLWLKDCCISPDEKILLFSAVEGSPPQINIWQIDIEKKAFQQLTFEGGNYPSFSPDGEYIIYTNTKKTEGGIWIMNKDGTEKRNLTKLNR
jgi:Tol biopolymer transport system component